MLNSFQTARNMSDLITNCSLRLDSGLIVYWPWENTHKEFKHVWYDDQSDGYDVSGNVIAYWYNGVLYATINTTASIRILETVMKRRTMYVPFSMGDYPAEDSYFEKWRAIEYNAKVEQNNEFALEAAKKAREMNLHAICNGLLSRCMKVPEDALPLIPEGKTLHRFMEHFDSAYTLYFGKYVEENGVINFVYVDGQTYVTKCQEVKEALEKAGFTRGEGLMTVQLAHGERFKSFYYQNLWDNAI